MPMCCLTDKWHVAVLQRKRRDVQETFDLARRAKAVVVEAHNAENVPVEEKQVNKHLRDLLQMPCLISQVVHYLPLV